MLIGCYGGDSGGGSGNKLTREGELWTFEKPQGQAPAELAPALAALRRAFGDDRRMWP